MAVVRKIEFPSPEGARKMLERANERWRKGKSVARDMSDVRALSCLITFDGEVYDDLPSAMELVYGSDARSKMFQARMMRPHQMLMIQDQAARGVPITERMIDGQAYMHAEYTWLYNAAFQVSDTPNYFRLSEALCASFLATELRGVTPADLQIPMPGFLVELPRGFLRWHNKDTGYHDVELIGVAERDKGVPSQIGGLKLPDGSVDNGWVAGYRLVVCIFGSPNENSNSVDDDGCGFYTIPLDLEDTPLEDLFARDESLKSYARLADEQRGMVGDAKVNGKTIRATIRHLLVNLLLYLSSTDPDVQHINARAIESIKKQRETKGKHFGKKRLAQLEQDHTFLVGSRVSVDPLVREYARQGGSAARVQQFRSLVRGHWKSQPYGSNRSLRKRIRIAPYARGGSIEKVLGHEYVVR